MSIRTRTKVIRRKHIIQPTGFGAYSSTCCLWEGEDVPAPWELYKRVYLYNWQYASDSWNHDIPFKKICMIHQKSTGHMWNFDICRPNWRLHLTIQSVSSLSYQEMLFHGFVLNYPLGTTGSVSIPIANYIQFNILHNDSTIISLIIREWHYKV